MKCQSCIAEISPEWVNAIKKNECPGCGGPILSDSVKELMDELAAAMEKMPNNPQGIAGWLVDNYNFHKIGSAQPVEKFHTKEDKKSSGPDFMKRTGMTRTFEETSAKIANMPKNKKFAQMASELESIAVEEDDETNDEPLTAEEKMILKQHEHSQNNPSFTDGSLTPAERHALSNITLKEPGDDLTKEEHMHQQRLERLRKQSGGGLIKRMK